MYSKRCVNRVRNMTNCLGLWLEGTLRHDFIVDFCLNLVDFPLLVHFDLLCLVHDTFVVGLCFHPFVVSHGEFVCFDRVGK